MKKLLLLIIVLSFSAISIAQTVPRKGFYAGLGAAFDVVKFSETDANTLGVSDVYLNGNLISSGYADGPYSFPESSENRFAPSVQLGYYQLFNNSNWLLGAKFTYSYIGSTSTSSVQNIPQAGSVGNIPFTGDAVVQSFQYSMNNQMTLTPYFGIATKKSFFYLGAGASYSQTKENINDIVGYAFIGNEEVNISGEPTSFSSTNWTFGYSVIAGGTYFITSSLFLDLSYTFSRTGTQTNDFKSSFSHTQGPTMTSGDLIGRTSSHAIINSFTLTINKAF